ncbi:MAG: DUF1844 domain-containing protein [Armatimonadetes bacterium]|nr:DUF1844 domain-containing protein [Armatimonadota bacterium]
MAKKPKEEQTYEVKDKRRINLDGALREDAEAEPQETTQEPADEDQEPLGEAPPPNVYAMLEFMASMLAETAWQLIGIRLAPGQKEIIKDLPQAKVAIDTLAFIIEQLNPHFAEEDRAAIRNLISDLQLNYVRQMQG